MIEKIFIHPTTNKQWRMEIDGQTIRTRLNGGKVMAGIPSFPRTTNASPWVGNSM